MRGPPPRTCEALNCLQPRRGQREWCIFLLNLVFCSKVSLFLCFKSFYQCKSNKKKYTPPGQTCLNPEEAAVLVLYRLFQKSRHVGRVGGEGGRESPPYSSCKHNRTVRQIVPDLGSVVALHTLATFGGARKEDPKPDATETLAERTPLLFPQPSLCRWLGW